MNKNRSITPAKSSAWTIGEGSLNGFPTLIRFRPNLEKNLGDSKFPRRLDISWTFKSDSSGMPDKEDHEKMHRFETKLTDKLEEHQLAVLTSIFTSNGIREWSFYVQDTPSLADVINETLEPGLPIELSIEDDPEWTEFKSFLSQFKN